MNRPQSPHRINGDRQNSFAVEPLENRLLLSKAAAVGILAGLPNASETNPTSTGHGSFTITRTGSTKSPLTVTYYVKSTSTAVSGVDFAALKGTVKIPKGVASVGVRVVPVNDAVHEGDETLTLYLSTAGIPFSKHRQATVTIHDNDAAPSNWWDNNWHYRVPISVDVGNFDRADQVVDRAINFTSVLTNLNRNRTLILDSIRVVETDSNHSVIDADVPFQFDQASDFNAHSKASGDLVFLVSGNTTASTTRHFDVYFDTAGTFSAPSVTPLVTVTDDQDQIQDDCFKITTSNPSNGKDTSYLMEKDNGGLSSLIDDDGNDWISYNGTMGSAGTYRGLPNLGVAGGAHPGFNSGSVTKVSEGPLKATFNVVSNDGKVALTWEFYPTFARVTVTKVDNGPYWFLYEATPGGSLNTSDTAVRSDGTSTTLNTNWTEDNSIGDGTSNGEWVYFNHTANDRFIYLVHNSSDNLEDSYFDLDDNMTVFGFGRTGLNHNQLPQMTDTPNVFTIGLNEGGDDFNAATDLINGAYRDISLSQATGQIQ